MYEFIAVALLSLFLAVVYLYRKNNRLEKTIESLKSGKQGLSTTYGRIFEQMIPFSKNFPFDPKRFKFLGDPVDGVVFDDDRIVFVEIKLNGAGKTRTQKHIKELVEQNKVYFEEIRGQL